MAVPKAQDLPVFFFFFLLLFLGSFVREPGAEARSLDLQEVEVLRKVAEKMKIGFWDFSVDPCDDVTGAGQWFVNSTTKDVLRQVECGNCDNETDVCHVTSIQLKAQNLTGVLPEELGNLTSLVQLDLTRNYLNGTIPTSWASLPLVNLTLLVNRVTGEIPVEFGNIKTLEYMHLESNLLQGQIPAALGNLQNLTKLMISTNNFTGEIPEALGNLTNLADFRIDGNAITGNIPSFITNWTKLKRLDMQGTSMSGPFPDSFASMEELAELRITDYKGDGSFPGLQQNKKLKYLILRNCNISGQIPNFIGGLSKLSRLDLSFNNLSGEIPSSLENLKSELNFLFLTNNTLNGTVPQWILSNSKTWDISFNSFTSSEQSNCKGQISSLSSQESNIPSCLRRNFPCSGKLKNYRFFINCGGGQITVGDKTYENNITPQGPTYFSQEDGKWAWSNTGYFVGNSEEAEYVTQNISVLNMKNPEEYYMTARLSPMSLRYYGLCLQRGNYTVSLYFAEIMFTDDETFSSLGRRIFDVSIQGNKVLKDFNIVEEANGTGKGIVKSFNIPVHDGTLDIHLQWLGKGTMAVPGRGVYGPLISAISVTPNFTPDLGEHELSTGAIVGIVIGCCIFVLLFLLAALFYLRKNRKEKSELDGLDLQTGFFSLKQIKSATHDFDPENKIGEGGFGPVYKGVLPDGSFIAVKRLSGKSKQGNREFVTEIGMISALQHPNLVKLYGCCIDGKQLFLIYEYLENNSLARALFGREGTRLNIDWPTRRKICMGIARGLAYLHEESVLKIVHRDIKATNILLDKDLNAKISDFGLAKLDEEENTHISTRIAGTVGYMSPEYAMRGYLTDKADVYSFGIVVLELISGKSNTNYRPKEDFVYLLDWAYVLQEQGKMLELVDPFLGSNYSRKEAEDMLYMSLQCTNPSPTLRPKMSTVVSMLEGTIITETTSKREQNSASIDMRFKAFQHLSQDSQFMGISSDTPWSNTTTSATSNQESVSDTSKLIEMT